MTLTKTTHPAAGKIVLEDEHTGIMISLETYEGLNGYSDEEIFEELRSG